MARTRTCMDSARKSHLGKMEKPNVMKFSDYTSSTTKIRRKDR